MNNEKQNSLYPQQELQRNAGLQPRKVHCRCIQCANCEWHHLSNDYSVLILATFVFVSSDDQPDLGLSNANFTTSSNSSLSSGGGSDSPSTSMEQMGGVGANISASGAMPMHLHHPHHQHSHQDSFHGSIGGSSNTSFLGGSVAGSQMTRHWNVDSDEEDDLINESDWSSNVAAEVLAALTDAEKKRQEIINGELCEW